MPRFSLKWLLFAVAFIGLSLVALFNANSVWQYAWENATLTLLLIAIVGTVCLVDEARMFCFGCLLFGATYFVLATGFFGFDRTRRLLPTHGLDYLHKHLFTAKSEIIPYGGSMNLGGDAVSQQPPAADGSISVMVIRPSRDSFTKVGNAIFCIPFGLLGGFIATRFYRRRPLM